MIGVDPAAAPPPGGLASAAETDMLLREFAQRTAEELASAIGALRLVIAARGSRTRWRMVAEALGRLECFADQHLVLAAPVRCVVDVAPSLEAVCRSIGASRPRAAGSVMELTLPATRVSGTLARRLCLVAAELVTDGVRNALDGRRGRMAVRLSRRSDAVSLSVSDDRPSGRRRFVHGERRDLVRELVDLAGGTLGIRSGPDGVTASVVFPADGDPGPDDDLLF